VLVLRSVPALPIATPPVVGSFQSGGARPSNLRNFAFLSDAEEDQWFSLLALGDTTLIHRRGSTSTNKGRKEGRQAAITYTPGSIIVQFIKAIVVQVMSSNAFFEKNTLIRTQDETISTPSVMNITVKPTFCPDEVCSFQTKGKGSINIARSVMTLGKEIHRK